jgi:serine/threonine-protein kinase
MSVARVIPQTPVRIGTGPAPSPGAMTNAADALRAEEVRRTRDLLRIGWLVAVGVAAAVLLTPGNARIGTALLVALAAAAAGSIWLHAQLADPSRYSPARMNVLALLAIICGQLGILYVGAFTAAPIVVALGLYFFCRTESRASAIAIYVLAAGGHLVEAILVITGVIDDPGFYTIGRNASLEAQLTGQFLLQMGYALCFWLARVTRASSLKSIEQLQKATRLAAQRDVQLAELRHDLDRALEIGGPGRFTGVIVGTWELHNVIGRGAMGEVYAATHTATPTTEAAVKLLRRELLADPRHVERFLREVRIASAIESPHVVRVLEASTPADAIPFLAMERLSGQTLGSLLRRGRALDTPTLISLVTHTADVLEHARTAGIVHRDIKPQNLFLTDDGTWKLLDFGVALLADSTGTLTRGGAVGTPAYMAPEQARGLAVDHRADIYALGAVIYRCATGQAPFVRPDTPSLMYAVVEEMPMRPSAITSNARALDDVLHIALAKDPAARFATAAELATAFTAALSDAPLPDLATRAAALSPWEEPIPVEPRRSRPLLTTT